MSYESMGQIKVLLFLTSSMVMSIQSETPVCEHMGVCFITVNETRFSCGETYENTTKAEFPPELSSTWTCLTMGKMFDFSKILDVTDGTHDVLVYFLCINNNEVKKILMAIEWTSNLKKDIELFGGSILMILSLCFNAADSKAALHRYVRVHGGLISSEMTLESFAALEDNVENIAFDNNQISSVKAGYFNKYKTLRMLSLSYNRITTIEMNSLPTASSLEMFNISYNEVGNDSLCNLKTWTSGLSNTSIGVTCITIGCSIDISTYNKCPDLTVTDKIDPTTDKSTLSDLTDEAPDDAADDISSMSGIIVTVIQVVIGALCGVVAMTIVTVKMFQVFQNSSRKEEIDCNDVENFYYTAQKIRDEMKFGDDDDDENFQINLIANNIPPLDHKMYYIH